MTQYLSVENGTLAYDLQGKGPLVVCSPSLGDIRAEYRFLIPQLVRAGYQVASLDVRGHGETSPTWTDYSVAAIGADILALIKKINNGPAILLGTSMSGGAAVWAAVEERSLVRALVLIDPFVDGDSDPFMVFILSILFARPWGASNWMRYYSSLYPTRKPSDFTDYTHDLKENLSQPGRMEAVMAMLKASKRASGERLSSVRQPVLVLMGSKDPDFKDPLAEADRVSGLLNARKKIIQEAGHYPHAEMPEVTGAAILQFLHSLGGNVNE